MIEKGENESRAAVRFLRVKELPGVELYRAVRSARSNPWHVHWVFAVTVAERGSGIHRTRSGAFPMTPGSIAVVNCGEAHGGLVPAAGDYSSRTIRIGPEYLVDCLSQLGENRAQALPMRRPVVRDPTLAKAVLHLAALLEKPALLLEKECELLEVLEALRARHGSAAPRPAPAEEGWGPIRRARDFLADCYQENVSLAQLAALAGMTPFHFARVFSRQVGVPPHAYLVQVRLRKATELLAAGKSQVEAALETGFCDQSHFCRAFKRKFGVPPGQYRA